MKIRFGFLLPFLLLVALVSLPVLSARASTSPQAQYATPTPLPDGRIIYLVQPGDTCIRISLLSGLSVDQIIVLNHLDADCNLQEGQQLLLGVGASANASPTPVYAISPTPSEPPPTPQKGKVEICVLVFDDQNGDTLHQEEEPAIIGAVVGVNSADGQYSASQTIGLPDETGYGGVCFEDIPEGHYAISAAIPEGYNATMPLNYELDAQGGDRIAIDFGAQSREQTSQPAADSGKKPSALLGLVGFFSLLAGGALLWYARQNTPSSPHTLR